VQDASSEFEAAVVSHRTFTPARLRTDWNGTGYGGDTTIDDLSGQMAKSWEVDHSLDDGYPDTVSFVAGSSVPELTTELAGRTVNGAPVTGAAYWSPQRADSPIYGYDRDIAPVTLDVGLVTSAGQQYARVFTGQMVNTPVKGGVAKLSTISAARTALMRYVQPPAFPGLFSGGLRATWPISFALWECGLPPGPERRTGTILHIPMHGALWPLIPAGNAVSSLSSWSIIEQTPADAGLFINDLDWIAGPYVSAPDLQLTATMSRRAYLVEIDFDRTAGRADAFSVAGNAARLEMWVKGVAIDVNHAPGGSGGVSQLCGIQLHADTVSVPTVVMGVNPSRQVSVVVFDGTNTRTLTSAATLPADDAWHFVGAAYDMTTDQLWVNLDGTVASSSTSMSTANLPATDTYVIPYPVFLSYLPCAEVGLATGTQANVDSYPLWRNDTSFDRLSRLTPSTIGLTVLAEPEPREAWAMIAEYAQAELAAVRPNELDMFEYLTPGWWVRDEQQVVTDSIATNLNAGPIGIDLDPTKIRNSVQVSYIETSIPTYSATNGLYRPIFQLSNDVQFAVPPGVTDLKVTLSAPTVGILSQISVLAAPDAVTIAANPALIGLPFVTLNDTYDGSGTHAFSDEISANVVVWDAGSVTVRFTNTTTTTWYLVNENVGTTAMRLVGLPVTTAQVNVLDEDATSIAARGPRGISVSATILQTGVAARRLARNLKMNLRRPVATIGDDSQGIAVTGNPLRQPGDLVEITDVETGVADDLWRLHGVKHSGEGATYTQQVVARRVFPVCIVGQGIVGQSLIGPVQ
jgi:hypothetical protein